jgi:cytochrome c peroxidase
MQKVAIQCLSVLMAFATMHAVAETLTIAFEPQWGGKALPFSQLVLTNALGQTLSVTRLDFLVSDFAVHRSDGTWLCRTNESAFLSLGQGRTRFKVSMLRAGTYDRIRFQIGLRPELNHADPAQHPAEHPLNPNLNGLHWSWRSGYVFFAFEGNWLDSERQYKGYSYHIATDRHLMTIELPVRLDLNGDCEIRVGFDADRVLAEHRITPGAESTHSREGDSLAEQLRRNIERSLRVRGSTAAAGNLAKAPQSPVVIAANATPYRLAISRSFPRPALPLDNSLTIEGVELGRRLFNEPLLSFNGAQSCASCHPLDGGFTDGRTVSIGAQGRPGTRNSMSLFNLAWKGSFFWDGRVASLREQVLLPIQNELEMDETLTNVIRKLAATEDYAAGFAAAFGSREIDSDRMARALEQFLLTQTSHDSKFDHFVRGEAQLTESEQRGFELFHTEYDPRRGQFGADCFHCHGGPLFQSQAFANNGLDASFTDVGRSAVTGHTSDLGKFAVPSLRNVEWTAPYMHDGRIATLEEVVEHYSTGIQRSVTLDPNLAKHPEGGVPLTTADKQGLVAFLRMLTDERLRGWMAGGGPGVVGGE